MKRPILLIVVLSILSLHAFSQEKKYTGVVVDANKKPIELFTVVITSTQDSLDNRYANVFGNGTYNFNLKKGQNEDLSCLIYSLGYKDINIPLSRLRDTIILEQRPFEISDVIVKAKKDVSVEITSGGGCLYNVQNSVLSDLNSSTMLLNFIPGVKASDEGAVSVIGSSGGTVIYLDGVKISSTQRLLALKSEDIKSVEVIRSPGARYKDAGAVLLIKTYAMLGFSSRLSSTYSIGDRYENITPKAEFTYARKKLVFTGAYSYKYKRNVDEVNSNWIVDDAIIPGAWSLNQRNEYDSKNNNNWYYGQVKYDINENHYISLDYSGSHDGGVTKQNSDLFLHKGSDDAIYKNLVLKNSDLEYISNQIHLFYNGDITENFSLNYNFDFSNRLTNPIYSNNWETTDLGDNTMKKVSFDQIEKTNGYALTNELLFMHNFGDIHDFTYGAEYAYLKDDVRSTIIPNTAENDGNTTYKLNSNYLKAFVEYSVALSKNYSLQAGVLYMYNRYKDNSNNYNGKNLTSFIPNISLRYNNSEKQISSYLNVEYNVYPPMAKALNDVTVIYNSPYEITVGNNKFTNTHSLNINWDWVFKNSIYAGLSYKYDKNVWLNFIETRNNNGVPLFVRTDENYKFPMHNIYGYVTYNKNFKWGLISLFGALAYNTTHIEQPDKPQEAFAGFRGYLVATGRFNLPKKFFISLDSRYNTSGVDGLRHLQATYHLDIYLEKQFFNNKLNVYFKAGGVIANKYEKDNSYQRGLKTYQTVYDYGQSHHNYSISVSWRFNNHNNAQAKTNKYINMLR